MHDDTLLQFDVVEVISGDLLRGEHPSGGNATIRVYGVDAPEKDHPLGPFAIELAREVTGGERVEVEVLDRDSRGRLVGRVWSGREFLGEALVRNGLARYDRHWAPEARSLQEYEQEARSAERGLWSRKNPDSTRSHRAQSPGVKSFVAEIAKEPVVLLGGGALFVASILAFVVSPLIGVLFSAFMAALLYYFSP